MDWKTTAFGIAAMVLWAGGAWAGEPAEPDTRPRNQWGCPAVIEGKWFPFSRFADEIFGDLEVRKDSAVFSVHGETPFRRLKDTEGREYVEFLKPFKEGSYASQLGKHATFTFPLEFQTDPIGGCLLRLEICQTQKDMVGSLAGRKDVYCGGGNFMAPRLHRRIMDK